MFEEYVCLRLDEGNFVLVYICNSCATGKSGFRKLFENKIPSGRGFEFAQERIPQAGCDAG